MHKLFLVVCTLCTVHEFKYITLPHYNINMYYMKTTDTFWNMSTSKCKVFNKIFNTPYSKYGNFMKGNFTLSFPDIKKITYALFEDPKYSIDNIGSLSVNFSSIMKLRVFMFLLGQGLSSLERQWTFNTVSEGINEALLRNEESESTLRVLYICGVNSAESIRLIGIGRCAHSQITTYITIVDLPSDEVIVESPEKDCCVQCDMDLCTRLQLSGTLTPHEIFYGELGGESEESGEDLFKILFEGKCNIQ